MKDIGEAERFLTDVQEVVGEWAWGIEMPSLIVRCNVDGNSEPVVIRVGPEESKALFELIYREIKSRKPDWLGRARREAEEARATAAEGKELLRWILSKGRFQPGEVTSSHLWRKIAKHVEAP